jgi:hypothetical protein
MARSTLDSVSEALTEPVEGRAVPKTNGAKKGFVWVEGGGVSYRNFQGANGTAEHFLMIGAPSEGSFTDQLRGLQERYELVLRQCGLTGDTAIFRRIFLSDILNQADAVCESPLVVGIARNPVSTSIIQQVPL